jgi:hypothetical protein
MSKKNPFAHLGISWQRMKIGVYVYKGTYTGAKANVCRANRSYAPKKWKTYSKDGEVFVERTA